MTIALNTTFKIELAQNHEIPSITKLVNAAYKELADMGLNYTATYQNDDKTKERISKGRCFVIKDNADKILGTLLMAVENYFTNRHTAYLGQFGVIPEYKKMGLGTKLIEFCENLAMDEGFVGIQLDTAIPAKHLVDWYQRRGYKIVGQEHYDGKTYDSYVFEKTFPSPTTYHFDENLRDVPIYPDALLNHVENLQQEYKLLQNSADQVRMLGELGVYLRQLIKLDDAETTLKKSLQLISQFQLGIKYEVQQKIRLAHVYQWKKDFEKSTEMFSDGIDLCCKNDELKIYLPFALQHAAKNLFDQNKFQEALFHFRKTLDLRIKNDTPQEQIESTKLAIKVTRDKIKKTIEIRRATPGDEIALANVHIQSWQEAYKNIVPQAYLDSLPSEIHGRIQNWSKTIVNPKRWLWIATVDNHIVGFALLGLPRDENKDSYIELGAIYLLEKFKGLGIGFSLLNTGFNFMSSLGYKKSYCWVLKGNPTINFYEKTGAKFSGLSKFDDIGGETFEELFYEWSSIPLTTGVDSDKD